MTKPHHEMTEQELLTQRQYCEQIQAIYQQRQRGTRPLACTKTFGCQQNEADTELIRGMLSQMGFGFTDDPAQSDLTILNTCAIREHAEMRVFGNLGELSHIKRDNPDFLIILCGCMAQQQSVVDKVKKSYPYVDLVFGTHALSRFPELLYDKLSRGRRVFDISGDEQGTIIEGITPIRKEGVRAWLSIMYGCNNFCSYCIVPYVRGRERSRRFEAIQQDFRSLLAQGYRDITLLGQNVNSYDGGSDGPDFPELLDALAQEPGDFRIRFMTSHPKDCSKKLLDVMARCDKVCKSIHLPVQSGSDRVLREMNRRYTAEHYLSLVDYARSVMPDITFTSDIIVGFPGETENDFEKTIELIERVRFHSLFTFIYSRRGGTRAASMPDPVPREEKQRWFDRLLDVQNRISREENQKLVGRTMRVLIDGQSDDKNYPLTARTDGFQLVLLKGTADHIGKWADVTIERCSTWALFASL
ncbi:MAG TPA: tRNA (N6-isopentenyl adenosine(37)-C2)-methylthiotransferase MiaB [Candidatus Ventrousia excrementavium]|uniref:tRNA-2-methylthio-N(6)-dimethylallyladenosine synthase n=1 Tax=Candidatus Ventrousia excrementavium TaxID=2840961 RepID=A0A9D1LLW2_9CLOT|nr:tRNA (N6-isopentenyl adenosine(37)-C2)-methylthiotransferase MiaB [Candidatus Ventrousia excrementavium]